MLLIIFFKKLNTSNVVLTKPGHTHINETFEICNFNYKWIFMLATFSQWCTVVKVHSLKKHLDIFYFLFIFLNIRIVGNRLGIGLHIVYWGLRSLGQEDTKF